MHALHRHAGLPPADPGLLSPTHSCCLTVGSHCGLVRGEIQIGDTGGGIPLEVRAKIFDPFFTTKEIGKGTGQGLAIARSVIVDKHAGIDFETVLGEGTTFIIRLPHVWQGIQNELVSP